MRRWPPVFTRICPDGGRRCEHSGAAISTSKAALSQAKVAEEASGVAISCAAKEGASYCRATTRASFAPRSHSGASGSLQGRATTGYHGPITTLGRLEGGSLRGGGPCIRRGPQGSIRAALRAKAVTKEVAGQAPVCVSQKACTVIVRP